MCARYGQHVIRFKCILESEVPVFGSVGICHMQAFTSQLQSILAEHVTASTDNCITLMVTIPECVCCLYAVQIDSRLSV